MTAGLEHLVERWAGEREGHFEFFHLAAEAFLIADARGTVVDANAAAAGLLGWDPGYLKGKPLVAFVAGDARRDFRAYFGAAAPSGANSWSTLMRRRDGTVVALKVNARRMGAAGAAYALTLRHV